MTEHNAKDTSISDSLRSNLDAMKVFIGNVSEKYHIPFDGVLELLKEKEKKSVEIPSFIFREATLGILEASTKYLKEELGFTYHKIAVLLGRDDRVVWVTYNKAIKKKKGKFAVAEPNYWLPISVFSDNRLGPLEAISKYLVDEANQDFASIARLLNRNIRSIWACYKRAKQKTSDKKGG